MPKTDKQKIIQLCNNINKKDGEGSIYTLGSKHANLKINRWSTGIEDLDEIIGGGMPEGRVIEIFGAEGSGKTTLLYHLCSLHNMALDIPIEGTFDANRAKVFGNKPKQLLVYRARYGEDAFNKTVQFAKAGMPLIGIDSVPSMVPKEDAEKVLGFKPGETDVTSGDLKLDGYKSIFEQMVKKFNFEYVISSLRVSHSASDNGWSACIYSRNTKEFSHSREYRITPIVDRVGGGDSFAGGVICGFVDGKDFKSALEFGVAASALKHTIPGDFNLVSRSDVDNLVGGDGSGRVQR